MTLYVVSSSHRIIHQPSPVDESYIPKSVLVTNEEPVIDYPLITAVTHLNGLEWFKKKGNKLFLPAVGLYPDFQELHKLVADAKPASSYKNDFIILGTTLRGGWVSRILEDHDPDFPENLVAEITYDFKIRNQANS